MFNIHMKRFLVVIALFFAASVAALWSWNTLSELFDWPLAQYKHVLATSILLLIIRWCLFAKNRAFSLQSATQPDRAGE